jgi:phosphomannomutase
MFSKIENEFSANEIIKTDGMKIIFDKKWIHIRKSNTEPILRIYAEAENEKIANELIDKVLSLI